MNSLVGEATAEARKAMLTRNFFCELFVRRVMACPKTMLRP
jgi:hypothetical protein